MHVSVCDCFRSIADLWLSLSQNVKKKKKKAIFIGVISGTAYSEVATRPVLSRHITYPSTWPGQIDEDVKPCSVIIFFFCLLFCLIIP